MGHQVILARAYNGHLAKTGFYGSQAIQLASGIENYGMKATQVYPLPTQIVIAQALPACCNIVIQCLTRLSTTVIYTAVTYSCT